MPRALPGTVSRGGADVALLLSGSPRSAPFSSESGSLCDQGQEEVGEKVLQCGGALNGGGRWKVQPEPLQLWKN